VRASFAGVFQGPTQSNGPIGQKETKLAPGSLTWPSFSLDVLFEWHNKGSPQILAEPLAESLAPEKRH